MKRSYLITIIIILVLVSSVLTWTFSNYTLVDKDIWAKAKKWSAHSEVIEEKDNEVSQLKNQMKTKVNEIDKNKKTIDDLNEQISELNEKLSSQQTTVSANGTTTSEASTTKSINTSEETNIVSEEGNQTNESIETQIKEEILFSAGLVADMIPPESVDINLLTKSLYSVAIVISNQTFSDITVRSHNFSLKDANGNDIGMINEDAQYEYSKYMDVIGNSDTAVSGGIFKGALIFTTSAGDVPYSVTWSHDGEQQEAILN